MAPSDVKSTIGNPFIELAAVNSTNTYAMEQLQANLAGHGAVYFAHNQTAGKGQHGKTWLIEPGTNITLSVILDTVFLMVSKPFPLSAMVAVACHDFFSSYAGEETTIKWPNDIYWRDRKAGGILIENILRGSRWAHSVIGLGLNIKQLSFPPDLPYATSLEIASGRDFDITNIRDAIRDSIIEVTANPLAALTMKDYNEQLYKRAIKQRFTGADGNWEATIIQVYPNGTLEVQLDDGTIVCYQHGQVLWDWS